ncbi:alpha-L-fucosidase [Granulicella tundricola]|uniref:alpha-L-fucosidase n=1 Tax=Granulicella tundricola (strain ATCC BAA-1859 / DSM 23138 / MP5ACTX9) TaxID=1198114 RepID=E8X6H3_GRATM|nr:alpha-L-fucosidase [Granulicella tundricola]ADW71057.1 glycoside hydrolase family 29 (alpha-L-fucosidase) [Granulicella tundricola MP5ACTX9]
MPPRLFAFRASVFLALLALVSSPPLWAQAEPLTNKPERLEWFRDQGLGLFIHWSVDSQLGVIISHSLAGASDEYVERFYKELPQTFNPSHFDPDALARLARTAGFRYMVFTTKHHNGFAMWNTTTTPFSITHTPYARDLTSQLFTAFRAQGVAPGVYFSPDDFLWLHNHGKEIQRLVPEVQPSANPGLLALDQQQVTELMTHYGPVSAVFFDGEAKDLRNIVWKLQPDAVVTRGAIETPEQNVPGAPLPGAWEANMTMGTAWGYQPSDEHYKSVQDLLHILIQTRARGGNLLLNVGLKPDGSLPTEQEERLRTLGSWMFVNSDAIYGTRPWVVTNEENIWFTRSRDHNDLYAIFDPEDTAEPWKRGDARDFVLKTVRATPSTTIGILGQNDHIVEYRPNLSPRSTFEQKPDGLHIHVMRAQRLRDSDEWPYPSVIHLTNVEEAFTPPVVHTLSARQSSGEIELQGDWAGAEAPGARFGFDYRIITGEDTRSRLHGWQHLPQQPASHPGSYSATFHPDPQEQYEFRSVLLHPLLTLYGETVSASIH